MKKKLLKWWIKEKQKVSKWASPKWLLVGLEIFAEESISKRWVSIHYSGFQWLDVHSLSDKHLNGSLADDLNN